MKLQKQLSRKVDGKEYPKYVLVIPPKIIKQLNWRTGDKLEIEIKENKLIIKK